MTRLSPGPILLAIVVMTGGCQRGDYDLAPGPQPSLSRVADGSKPPAKPADAPKPAKRLPPVPLAKDSAASKILSDLHRVGSELTPSVAGCSQLPASVSSFVSSIASHAKLLQLRIGAGATTRALERFAGTLRGSVASVSERTPEKTELRRLHSELTASVRDIAETLALLAEKLSGQDVLATEQARARLRNAAGNYIATVRTLVSECAPG